MAIPHILAVGRVSNGAVEMLPPLQSIIDAGEAAQADADALIDIDFEAELADLREGMLDDEFNRRGC